MLLTICNNKFAKVVRIYLNIPQIKIIIITFRTTSSPFQHEVCDTIKDQISWTSDLLS